MSTRPRSDIVAELAKWQEARQQLADTGEAYSLPNGVSVTRSMETITAGLNQCRRELEERDALDAGSYNPTITLARWRPPENAPR